MFKTQGVIGILSHGPGLRSRGKVWSTKNGTADTSYHSKLVPPLFISHCSLGNIQAATHPQNPQPHQTTPQNFFNSKTPISNNKPSLCFFWSVAQLSETVEERGAECREEDVVEKRVLGVRDGVVDGFEEGWRRFGELDFVSCSS